MKKYEVAGSPLTLGAGRIGLTPEQAKHRMHALAETGKKGVYDITAEVQFKAGEVIVLDGEIPKSLEERLVAPGTVKTAREQKFEAGVDVDAIRAEAARDGAREAARRVAEESAAAFKLKADAVRASLEGADEAADAVAGAAADLASLPEEGAEGHDAALRADVQATFDRANANAEAAMATFRRLVAEL